MSDFFEKLKKGMDAENNPETESDVGEDKIDREISIQESILADSATENTGKSPEVKLTSATPKKKKRVSRKKSKSSEKGAKIKVKKESALKEDEIEENDDIFQKDGQLTIDVFETDKYVVIQSAIAGIKPENLDITIEKDMVSIKGKREKSIEEEAENYFYQECYWGRFSREVVLPCEVDKKEAEAIMKNGILTIKIPKTNPSNSQKLNIKNIE